MITTSSQHNGCGHGGLQQKMPLLLPATTTSSFVDPCYYCTDSHRFNSSSSMLGQQQQQQRNGIAINNNTIAACSTGTADTTSPPSSTSPTATNGHYFYQQRNGSNNSGGCMPPTTTTTAMMMNGGGPMSITAQGALERNSANNMTECVAVPSSEHVAEIVGKQGCKIKALRDKTNTYIKTPVRGEESIFVITGRLEDVEIAKFEITQAAEHFTQIRAQRRLLQPPTIPGQVTEKMQVPLRLVGLIVGPKGQTIKRIQQDTNTYIVTPGREKEPVFDITGPKDGVDKAREQIAEHILARTGNTLEELLRQQAEQGIISRPRSRSVDTGTVMTNFDIGCWNVDPEPESDGSDSGMMLGNIAAVGVNGVVNGVALNGVVNGQMMTTNGGVYSDGSICQQQHAHSHAQHAPRQFSSLNVASPSYTALLQHQHQQQQQQHAQHAQQQQQQHSPSSGGSSGIGNGVSNGISRRMVGGYPGTTSNGSGSGSGGFGLYSSSNPANHHHNLLQHQMSLQNGNSLQQNGHSNTTAAGNNNNKFRSASFSTGGMQNNNNFLTENDDNDADENSNIYNNINTTMQQQQQLQRAAAITNGSCRHNSLQYSSMAEVFAPNGTSSNGYAQYQPQQQQRQSPLAQQQQQQQQQNFNNFGSHLQSQQSSQQHGTRRCSEPYVMGDTVHHNRYQNGGIADHLTNNGFTNGTSTTDHNGTTNTLRPQYMQQQSFAGFGSSARQQQANESSVTPTQLMMGSFERDNNAAAIWGSASAIPSAMKTPTSTSSVSAIDKLMSVMSLDGAAASLDSGVDAVTKSSTGSGSVWENTPSSQTNGSKLYTF